MLLHWLRCMEMNDANGGGAVVIIGDGPGGGGMIVIYSFLLNIYL